MSSYATVEDLADALGIAVNASNTQALQDCLDAAAAEIDRICVDITYVGPPPSEPPTIVKRVNINRAVEWWKAPAAYNGGVGFVDTGTMTAPATGFERHAAILYTLTDTGASGVA